MEPEHRRDRKDKRQREPHEKISRALSAILRHKAEEVGLQIDRAGFVPLDDVIKYLKGRGHKDACEEVIEEVVATNNKKRFELMKKGHTRYIRATQGHSIASIESEALLTRIQDPSLFPSVVHGTYFNVWPLIKEGGLKRMARNHIHFAPGLPREEGVISGMRGSCDVYIEIDMLAAMKDGIDFFISSNNVILTEGIDGVLPPQYFRRVVSKNGDVLLDRTQ